MKSEFISDYKFGRITILSKTYSDDIILLDSKVVPKWWRKEGHNLSKEDLNKILDYKPELLIIGTGDSGLMKVPQELTTNLNFEVISLPTSEAVKKYNFEIKGNKKIAGAFHITC